MNLAKNRGLDSLIAELARGIAVVDRLDDVMFTVGKGGESSIGAHIRHNLDFINSLLNGIADRRIDYNARARDPRVENDREYAAEQLSVAARRLQELTPGMLAAVVMVRSEVDEETWHASSVSREIEFLHSHTVHHYALIARTMTESGHEVGKSFGVAPSTVRFRESTDARNVYAGS